MGSVVWALASIGGIAVLLEKSVVAFTICKLVGAVYLGYLGLRSLLACVQGRQQPAPTSVSAPAKSIGKWTAFRQRLLGNLLNPKAGPIFATILPQFILPGDSLWRLLLMLCAYEAILFTWLHLYGYLLSRAGQSRFGRRIQVWLQGVTGGVLLALGAKLAFEQKV
jgi:threonine/homoserine/homoserine lactone efflux protein